MISSPPPGRTTSRTEKPLEALRTERLVLVALTPELARAALEDRAKLGRMIGAQVPESWPGADFARMLPRLAEGVEQTSSGAEPTRLAVHAADERSSGRRASTVRPTDGGRSKSATASSRPTAGGDSPPRRRGP